MIALLLNVPGLGFDLMIDGLEMLAGPVLVASLLLPKLAPAPIVDQMRAERGGPLPQEAFGRGRRAYSPPNHLS
jgi:hypothetical protein